MASFPVKSGVFGFSDVFGSVCSFGKNNLFGSLVMFGLFYCSVCSVVFVEKMCKNMFESLWESCVKKLHVLWKRKFYTYFVGNVEVLHALVEKFCYGLCTWFYRGKWRVLHSFHKPYYYYYYFI